MNVFEKIQHFINPLGKEDGKGKCDGCGKQMSYVYLVYVHHATGHYCDNCYKEDQR